MCTFPISTMHDQADEHSKKLLDVSFYHNHKSNEELLKTILANKGNPNIQDTDGDTPLHLAVNSKHSDYVAILLAAGANPDIINNKGDTPLRMATSFSNLTVIQLLLNNRANPNITTHNNESPLHSAVHKELNPQILKLLLSANADPNLKNGWGHTPLHQVMLSGTLNSNMITATQLFLQYGAQHNSVSHKGYIPLQLLTSQQWEVSRLEKHIAQHIGRLLVWHSLLLHDFAKLVHAHIARLIASHAAPVCATEPTIWATKPVPLDWDFYHTLGNAKLLKELLAHKANPNRQNSIDGSTPLHCAIQQKNSKYASILLAAGADPNRLNDYGNTPLHFAVRPLYRVPVKSIQLLLNNKANPNLVNNNNETPLYTAIHMGVNPKTVECLLSAKADPNIKNREGNTPLYETAICWQGIPKMFTAAQLLVQYGTQVDSVNYEGYTLLDILRSRKNYLNQHIGSNPQEKSIIRKIGRLAVWHYILLHEFSKLVSPESARIITSHVAAICAEQPTIWTKKLLPAAPALTLAAPVLANEQSSSSCQLI